MKCLNNWSIIELSEYVATGTINYTREAIITDPIMAILEGYLITKQNIYKLGPPCRVWMGTPEAREKLDRFDSGKCVK